MTPRQGAQPDHDGACADECEVHFTLQIGLEFSIVEGVSLRVLVLRRHPFLLEDVDGQTLLRAGPPGIRTVPATPQRHAK